MRAARIDRALVHPLARQRRRSDRCRFVVRRHKGRSIATFGTVRDANHDDIGYDAHRTYNGQYRKTRVCGGNDRTCAERRTRGEKRRSQI
jgi:hypothetical protein